MLGLDSGTISGIAKIGHRVGHGHPGIGRGDWDLCGQPRILDRIEVSGRLLQEILPAVPDESGPSPRREVGGGERRLIGGGS